MAEQVPEMPETDEVEETEETEVPPERSTSLMEDAGQQDTSTDSLVPPGATPYPPGRTEPAEVQVQHLEAFLATHFPDEVGRTNYQVPETPVATATRLLMGLHAHVAASTPQVRCQEQYCNKPLGHRDGHGWVHYG